MNEPPAYRVVIPPRVQRLMRRRIQSRDLRRVFERIHDLERDPRPRGVEKLTADRDARYRVRQGDWRIIYVINDRDRTITVDEVARRNEGTYG